MTFPRLLVIVDRERLASAFQKRPESAILAACQGGAKWFCVREKTSAPRELLDWTRRVSRVSEKFGAQLFVNGRADLARAAHADGLHLPENDLPVSEARVTLSFHTPIGVSVHSLEAARRAEQEGANYLVFGSVFPTQSHPEASAQGLEALAEVVSAVQLPVLAIGGVSPNNVAACLQAGAHGIAAIGSVWNGESATQITANVRALRAALGEHDEPSAHHSAMAESVAGEASPVASLLRRNQT